MHSQKFACIIGKPEIVETSYDIATTTVRTYT